MSDVRVERGGPGPTVVLDRPGRRNALTLPMWVELARVVRQLGQLEPGLEERRASTARHRQDGAGPLYLRGGGGYFCAGADLATLAWARESPRNADEFVHAVVRCLLTIHEAEREVVAVVEGGAAGGGVEIMAACDRRVVVGDASLVFPFGHHGMTLDGLTRWRLHHLVGDEQAERLVDGRHVVGVAEAQRMGLVDERYPSWAAFVEAERGGDRGPTRTGTAEERYPAGLAQAVAPMRQAFPPHVS